MQEQDEASIQAFVRALELNSTPEIANEVSKLYLRQGNPTLALEYASYAIDMAATDVLSIQPESLADLYSDRVKIYEQLRMFEHARSDQRKILEADPNFIQRQILRQNAARETLENGLKF